MQISRRDLMLGGAATAVALSVPGRAALAQAPVTDAQFLALSKTLTGVADLDPAVAKTLLGGLEAAGQGGPLAELLRVGAPLNPAAKTLENAIVASWYSGLYETGKGQAVATFDQALVWQALTFTKHWGECGGDTGYWANPPEA
jgi:hypothetical protein